MFAPYFTLIRHDHVRHVAHLDRDAIADLVLSTYRLRRVSVGMSVTLSRDVLRFERNQ
jgi:hypothetical protein